MNKPNSHDGTGMGFLKTKNQFLTAHRPPFWLGGGNSIIARMVRLGFTNPRFYPVSNEQPDQGPEH